MLYKAFSFPMPLVHTSASVYEGFLVLVPVNQMVKQFLCVHPFCMDFLSELSQRVYLYPVVMLLLFFVSLMFPQTTRGVRNLQTFKLIMTARLPFPKILPDSAGQSQSLTPSGSLWWVRFVYLTPMSFQSCGRNEPCFLAPRKRNSPLWSKGVIWSLPAWRCGHFVDPKLAPNSYAGARFLKSS